MPPGPSPLAQEIAQALAVCRVLRRWNHLIPVADTELQQVPLDAAQPTIALYMSLLTLRPTLLERYLRANARHWRAREVRQLLIDLCAVPHTVEPLDRIPLRLGMLSVSTAPVTKTSYPHLRAVSASQRGRRIRRHLATFRYNLEVVAAMDCRDQPQLPRNVIVQSDTATLHEHMFRHGDWKHIHR